MDPLMISAASGMKARMESLEMLANNVANSATAGFKADREFYNLYVSQEALAGSAGGLNPDPATLPVIEKHWTDFGQGTLMPTGNPLDVAIAGKGFFVVDTQSGPVYTRNGNFRLSADGRIVTQDGQAVRFLKPDGKPATIDPAAPIEVDTKGEVHQNGQVVGGLVMIDAEGSRLEKMGSAYFKLNDPNPKLATGAEVHQRSLESANVPVGEAAVRLVSVMRQFEMLQKAISIGGEMDRAGDEVAKVGS